MTPRGAPSATTAAAVIPEDDDRAIARKPAVVRWLGARAAWIFLLDIALIIFFTADSPGGRFLSIADVQSLLLGGTEALLLALGLALMIGAGKFDLSLGANLVLASVLGAKVMLDVAGPANASGAFPHAALGIIFGLLTCIAAGLAFGAVNGVLISYLGINSLIATLGTLGAGTGLVLVITNGNDVAGLPSQIQSGFGLKTVADVPLPAIAALVLAAIFWLIIRYTRFGLRTLAIGSSRYAAERAGLSVNRHLFALTLMAGGLAGLAGFVDISHYLTTTINGHPNDALNAVTAVVIGGTLLEGGQISIVGTLWGVALSEILLGGLDIIGVSSAYQQITIGAVLIAAVSLDRLTFLRRKR